MDAEIDAYRVLQVRPDAAAAVIQAAYRALARLVHPDSPGGDPLRMAELNRAYSLVGSAAARAAYDHVHQRRSLIPTGPGAPLRAATPPAAAPSKAAPDADPDRLDFGRYAGWTLAQVARRDPDYLRWLSRHSSGVRYRNRIAALLPKDDRVGRREAFTTHY